MNRNIAIYLNYFYILSNNNNVMIHKDSLLKDIGKRLGETIGGKIKLDELIENNKSEVF